MTVGANANQSQYEILYIDNEKKLERLCENIKDAPYIVIDTEFVREKTYRAKLCLIQIATDDLVACIDPIAITNLKPFMDIINNGDKLKILHAARQDYEIFHDLNETLPAPVFDSQLAASLLGYGEQIGYASLVQKVLNIQLDKAHARTDWSRRPLSQEQIKYASDDVYYLRQIFPLLQSQLKELGRENWLDEDFAKLCQPELFITRPEDAWKRVKGINRLRPRQLAAAINLAAWREQVAIEKNRPRRWILADDIIVAIASLLPKNISQLESIANIKKSLSEPSSSSILDCVKNALEMNESDLPHPIKPTRLSAEQEVIADLLMAQLRLAANEHKISATNIASRKDMTKVILGETNVPLLSGWRYQLAGEKIKNLLSGKTSIQIKNGNKVNIVEN